MRENKAELSADICSIWKHMYLQTYRMGKKASSLGNQLCVQKLRAVTLLLRETLKQQDWSAISGC